MISFGEIGGAIGGVIGEIDGERCKVLTLSRLVYHNADGEFGDMVKHLKLV